MRKLFIICGLLLLIAIWGIWWQLDQTKSRNPPALSSAPARATPSGPAVALATKESKLIKANDLEVEFPSIGKVQVTTRPGTVSWSGEDGKVGVLKFKFQYAANGVWVRAIYRGTGEDYPETSPDELVVLYGMGGEEVKGIPSEPLSVDMLTRLMSRAHERVAFEKASKIVLEYLMVDASPSWPPEPALMIKVWGVEKPSWASGPPRMRITYYLIHSYNSTVDDDL